MELYIIIFVIILLYVFFENTNGKKENLVVHPKCDHIPKFKNPYQEGVYYSNVENGFDCYQKCINNADCPYVGIAFDCYNNCFDNISSTKRQNNTLGDYDQ